MENYLSSEISQTEKELTRLKTTMSKSAGVIQTVAKTVSVSVPLSLNSAQTSATGHVDYRVTPEKDAIIVSTLDWYSGDVLIDYRVPRTVRAVYITESENNSNRIVRVGATGTQFGSGNDVQRLINGESVNVTCTLTIRATCNFSVEAI